MKQLLFAALSLGPACLSSAAVNSTRRAGAYGVDVSWPIHHGLQEPAAEGDSDPWTFASLLSLSFGGKANNTKANKASSHSPFGRAALDRYQKYMDGCYSEYDRKVCDFNEVGRLSHTLGQCANMKNFTELGFTKLRLPHQLYKELRRWYLANKEARIEEPWSEGSTFGE